MTDPLKTTAIVDGKRYIVLVYPEMRNEPFSKFCRVYRQRKDGSAGLLLGGHHKAAWAAWKQVDADMCAECDRLGFTEKAR